MKVTEFARLPRCVALFATLLVLSPQLMSAAIATVCGSGCDYSALQAAIDAAADCSIDTIELKAGETFSSPSPYRLRARPCSGDLTIRTSRWKELPSLGYRADPAKHATMMPVVTTTNPGSVMSFGFSEISIIGAHPAAGTLDLDGYPTTAEVHVGTALACSDRTNGFGPDASPQPGIPAPLARRTPYFVTAIGSVSGSQLLGVQVSLTPGGAAVAISDASGIKSPSTNYYAQPQCSLWDNASNVVIRGLDIRPPDPGPLHNYGPGMITIGGSEYALEAMPANIRIQQSLLRGDPSWLDRGAPRIAVWADGRDVTIQDSYMEALAFSDESKCIATTQAQSLVVRNNTCATVAAMILAGGAVASVKNQPVQGVTVEGNYVVTPGRMFYKEGSGPPPEEPCYFEYGSGAFYRDTSAAPNTCANGACYECQSSERWAQNRSAVYRNAGYLPKAKLEFKNCHNCTVQGNVFRGNPAGADGGNTGCMGLVLTEQSALDSNGIFFTDHQNIVFQNNWCDRVWSGILIGQTAPIGGPGPYNITNITVVDQNTFEITLASPHSFTPYTYAFFQGITATGTMGQLNNRWAYPTSFPSANKVRVTTNQSPDYIPANGTYGSGGTVQGVRWRLGQNLVARNNLLTRVGQFPQLSRWPNATDALSRPLRVFDGVTGGPQVTKTTTRIDQNGQPQFAVTLESVVGHGSNPNVVLKDSILAASRYALYEGISQTDCSPSGYGGFFSGSDAMSRLLQYGPNASWKNLPGCSSRLMTATSDAAVGFAGSDQSVIANSRLSSTSPYSASNRSAVLISSDGSDLGADVELIAAATSGAVLGTPTWADQASLTVTPGQTGATETVSYTAPDSSPCSLSLYTGPARISANLHPDTLTKETQSDQRIGNVADGLNRQFILGSVSPLDPGTLYYYALQCGDRLMPGQFRTSTTRRRPRP